MTTPTLIEHDIPQDSVFEAGSCGQAVPPCITAEEDEPLDPNQDPNRTTVDLSTAEINKLEKTITLAERTQFIKLKDKGYWLLIICLVSVVALYLFDVLLLNLGLQNSTEFSTLFEFFKLIATTLIGWVFAKNASTK